MSAHTPGPWSLKSGGEIAGPDSRPVAYAAASRMEREDVVTGTGPATANAHLIAAAPELLAVCQRMVKELDEGGASAIAIRTMIEDANDAIAKATGAANV